MAKHAHRLMLNEKKTWRCTLPNCRYFIHLGLAHILPGQESICWTCGEQFTLDTRALEDDMPKCAGCRLSEKTGRTQDELTDFINRKIALAKEGVNSESEIDPVKRATMKALGILPKTDEDEIEVIEPDDKE